MRLYLTTLLLCFFCVQQLKSADYYFTALNDDWHDPNSWFPVGIPGPNDNVLMSGFHTINISTANSATYNNIDLSSNVIFIQTAGSFTCNGTLTMPHGFSTTQMALTNVVMLNKGKNQWSIPTNGWSPGVYRIVFGDTSMTILKR